MQGTPFYYKWPQQNSVHTKYRTVKTATTYGNNLNFYALKLLWNLPCVLEQPVNNNHILNNDPFVGSQGWSLLAGLTVYQYIAKYKKCYEITFTCVHCFCSKGFRLQKFGMSSPLAGLASHLMNNKANRMVITKTILIIFSLWGLQTLKSQW